MSARYERGSIILTSNKELRRLGRNFRRSDHRAVNAISEAKDAHEKLQKVQDIVKSIDAGETPSVTENPYADLARRYKSAASDIRQAPLPTDFDDSPYRFSLDDLQNCATRQASLDKGAGFLQELQAADDRGAAALSDLDDALAGLQSTPAMLV